MSNGNETPGRNLSHPNGGCFVHSKRYPPRATLGTPPGIPGASPLHNTEEEGEPLAQRRPLRLRLRPYQVGLLLLASSTLVPFFVLFVRGVQLVRAYELRQPLTGATILDRNGEVVAVLGSRHRTYVPLPQIPVELREAIVATEDARFYHHFGIDPVAIARAIVANLRAGRTVQGASTITQQLAKNVFLTPSRTLGRKLQELVLALVLEARYSKDDILELYLNSIYFGEGATGVQAAALTYFGKPVSRLDLAESALLAGIPRAPAFYDPYRNPEAALGRRQVVLDRMVAEGYLTPEEAAAAAGTPLVIKRQSPAQAPYFVDWIRDQLLDRYTPDLVFRGGLRVYTTLDLTIQRAAEAALAAQPHQGAIVALDHKTGGILALVGGRDYLESQFNRAVKAFRQPGSAMKPFVYATALERGYTMADAIFVDRPINIAGYAPANFRDEYLWTTVTLKHALVESLNSIAVQLLNRIGIDPVFSLARQAGLPLRPEDRHLALALGGISGVTPLQLAEGYSIFPAGGIHRPVYAIARVVDSDGRVLEKYSPPAPERLLSRETAYLMTNIMEDVILTGTGQAARPDPGYPAAGKTGTSDYRTNAWFGGFTPDLTAVVYIGNDDNSSLGETGGLLAAPVWGDFIRRVIAARKMPAPLASRFPAPSGIVTGVPIDWITGGIATVNCPSSQVEWDAFRETEVPAAICPLHPGPLLGPQHAPGASASPSRPTPSTPPAPVLPPASLPLPSPDVPPMLPPPGYDESLPDPEFPALPDPPDLALPVPPPP